MASTNIKNINNTNDVRVSYNAREFDELKGALVRYTQQYFPNSYRDFNEASPGMMLLELSAYVGDVLNFYIDKQYQEMLLPMASERKNVLNLAKMLGYKYNNVSAAYVPLTFTQEFTADSSNKNEIKPDWSEAAIIPKGTTVTGTGNINFQTLDVVDFTISASGDSNLIVQSDVDATTGLASKFKVTRQVNAVGATTATTSKTFEAPSKFSTLEISEKDLIEIISVVDSNGNNWYEVDYLAQDRVPIETHYTSDDDRLTAYSPLSGSGIFEIAVPYKLQYIKTTKRFTVHKDENMKTILTFGNGVIRNGQTLETTFLATEQIGITLPGEDGTGLTDSIDPTLGDEFDTLGETPSYTSLTVTYRKAGNIIHNVVERSLNAHGYKGTSSGNISVTNLEPARGASANITTREIKEKALANFKSQNRCVTREDYEARLLNLPAQFGGVAKVYFDRMDTTSEINERTPELQNLYSSLSNFIGDVINNETGLSESSNNTEVQQILSNYFDFNADGVLENLDVDNIINRVNSELMTLANVTGHILCYDNSKKLSDKIPSLLYSNINNYLNEFRILTDDVIIYPGKVINFGVIFDVVAEKFAQKDKVKALCFQKINSFFEITKQQFREPIYVNQLEFELMGIEGVRAVNYVTITQDKDWRQVDTPDVFNLGGNYGLYTTVFSPEENMWIDLEDSPGYGYQYDFSQFYDTSAVGSSLVGDGIILPSKDPAVFELKDYKHNIKGIVR